MKLKYIFFGVVMAVVSVVCALIGDFLIRFFAHIPFSWDRFTFALLFAFMVIYYYNRAAEINKEE